MKCFEGFTMILMPDPRSALLNAPRPISNAVFHYFPQVLQFITINVFILECLKKVRQILTPLKPQSSVFAVWFAIAAVL